MKVPTVHKNLQKFWCRQRLHRNLGGLQIPNAPPVAPSLRFSNKSKYQSHIDCLGLHLPQYRRHPVLLHFVQVHLPTTQKPRLGLRLQLKTRNSNKFRHWLAYELFATLYTRHENDVAFSRQRQIASAICLRYTRFLRVTYRYV